MAAINKARHKHPLNALYDMTSVALGKVHEQLEYHRILRANDKEIIDFAERHLKKIIPLAQNCTVVLTSSTTAKISFYDGDSSTPHKERIVDSAARVCGCTEWQDKRLVCLHGLAFLLKKHGGWSPLQCLLAYSGTEYKVLTEDEHAELALTNSEFKLISIAPDDALHRRSTVDPEIVRARPPSIL